MASEAELSCFDDVQGMARCGQKSTLREANELIIVDSGGQEAYFKRQTFPPYGLSYISPHVLAAPRVFELSLINKK